MKRVSSFWCFGLLMGGAVCPSLDGVLPSALLAAPLIEQPDVVSRGSLRGPLRVIQDQFSSPSAVAVDIKRNEVVVSDENKFQILVYDRLDNTPPEAAMTEPKRLVGGDQTQIEFQCGVWVDQQNGDIYAVNNDTKDKLVIFSRHAEGNVPPDRWLATPHGTFGIAVDEEHRELFLTVQHDSAIVVYDKMASEEEPPIRLIQGTRTRLADPHGIALDPIRDLLFVANYGSTHEARASSSIPVEKPNWPLGGRGMEVPGSGKFNPPSINVYARTARGDVAPLRIIEGPKTQLNWPTGVAFNPQRNEVLVSNDVENSVLVFDGDANGDVAPKRVLGGPRTGIDNPTGLFVDLQNQELWVANFGGHAITVYDIQAGGDTPPLRSIRTAPPGRPSLMIGNPGAVAYDSRRKEILVPN